MSDTNHGIGRPATPGAFEVTRTVAMYDSDGGVNRRIAGEETRRYFRQKRNAEASMRPGENVSYRSRWVSDYDGPIEDER